jgi:hypothetical protein
MQIMVEDHVIRTGTLGPRFIAEGLVGPKGSLFLEAVNEVAARGEAHLWVFPKHFIMASKARQAYFLHSSKATDDDINLFIADYLRTLGFDRNSYPKGADHAFRLRRGMRSLLAKQVLARETVQKERQSNRRTTLGAVREGVMTLERYEEIARDCQYINGTSLDHARGLIMKVFDADPRVHPACYWLAEGATETWAVKRTGHKPLTGLYEIRKPVERDRSYPPRTIHSAWMAVVPKGWGLQATKRDMVVLPAQGLGVWVLLAPTSGDRWLAIRIGQKKGSTWKKTVIGYGVVVLREDGRARLVDPMQPDVIGW